jgi:hypothetical protein
MSERRDQTGRTGTAMRGNDGRREAEMRMTRVDNRGWRRSWLLGRGEARARARAKVRMSVSVSVSVEETRRGGRPPKVEGLEDG